MKSISIVTILAFLFSAPPHDIPMGVFSLTFDETEIRMDIKLEAEDIEQAVAKHYQKKSTERLVEQYILDHSQWIINDQVLIPELCSTEKEVDHYYIKINFSLPLQPLATMTIINDCLLNEIDNHSNIIYVNQKGEQRGFRLHEKRQRTSFTLR